MKLDVEGHEGAVLKGAEPFLRQHLPTLILFESHDDGDPFWSRSSVRVLGRLGYDIYEVGKSLLRLRLRSVPAGSEPRGRGYDYVAIVRTEEGVGLREVLARR